MQVPNVPSVPSLGARLAHLLRLGSKWGMLKLQRSRKGRKGHQASSSVSSSEASSRRTSSEDSSALGEAACFSPDQESLPYDGRKDQSGAVSSQQVLPTAHSFRVYDVFAGHSLRRRSDYPCSSDVNHCCLGLWTLQKPRWARCLLPFWSCSLNMINGISAGTARLGVCKQDTIPPQKPLSSSQLLGRYRQAGKRGFLLMALSELAKFGCPLSRLHLSMLSCSTMQSGVDSNWVQIHMLH